MLGTTRALGLDLAALLDSGRVVMHVAVVPEPATPALLAIALLALRTAASRRHAPAPS